MAKKRKGKPRGKIVTPPSQEKGSSSRKKKAALAAVLVCLGGLAFFAVRAFRSGETTPARDAREDRLVRAELKIEDSAKAYNERAVEVAQRLAAEFPGRPDPMFLLGQVKYEQQKYKEAANFWNEALKIDSSQPYAYQAMGFMALEEGDNERAISHWRKALEADAQWPAAHRAIALGLMHMGRVEEALPELEADLSLAPQSAQTHFLLGQAYFQLGRLDEARKSYESAIKFSPRFASPYYGLSRTLVRLGQKDAAKEQLDKFNELKGGERKAKREGEEAYDDLVAQRTALARTYDRAGMTYFSYGNDGKAAVYFRVTAKLDPTNADSRFNLANVRAKAGETKDAIRLYEEVTRLRPQDVRPYLALGGLYARVGRASDAEESYRKVIAFVPDHPIGYRALANLFLQTKTKVKEAEALARKAVALEPSASNYDLLASACYLNGNYSDAENAASKAAELEPENRVYKERYERIRQRR
jgi:tetratricopeptide (TPR) repeat protein